MINKEQYFLILFFWIFNHFGSLCQPEFLSLLQEDVFKHTSTALTIIDGNTGDKVVDYNGDKSLIPASTLKVITTLSALELLGKEHQYSTELYYTGELLNDGTLMGNILIKGSGDPSFGSPFDKSVPDLNERIDQVVKSIIKTGITCIEGGIILNSDLFVDAPVNDTWQWNDLGNYYAAGVWSFNVHENCYFIRFNRSADAFHETTIHSIEPFIPNLKIRNNVKTGQKGSGDNAYIFGSPYSDDIIIEGTIPPGTGSFEIKGAIPNPSAAFQYWIKQSLSRHNIYVSEANHIISNQNRLTLIDRFNSSNLSRLITYANEKSNNLYCEVFLKTLGKNLNQEASAQSGVEAIQELLEKWIIDHSGMIYTDGSGLSTQNRITTNILAEYMFKYNKSHMSNSIDQILPRAGLSGNVKGMFNGLNKDIEIYLKSGSMSQVLGYSGMIKFKKHQYYVSFISNGQSSNGAVRIQFERIIMSFIKHQQN
jgi:D-alanyl-D-alanine carboxypeptidase/D-alanyl-D-alanine-endopeptidase (penicillin-binding protein 4)